MKKQSGSAHVIIIIVLVIALVGTLGFVFWQNFMKESPDVSNTGDTKTVEKIEKAEVATADPYEGWSTYESSQDGYTLKYPADWIVVPETDEDGVYIRNFDPTSKPANGAGYPDGYMNLRVDLLRDDANFQAAYGMSTTEWYNALGVSEVRNGIDSFMPGDVKATKVNGVEAKAVKVQFTETNENIYFIKDGSLYRMILYPYGSSSDKKVKLIIDSFTTE